MKNNNNQFDKELHDRISIEELPFDPFAWEMMEEKLDEKSKRRFLFWISANTYLIAVVSVLLLATLTYWSFHYDNLGNSAEIPTLNDIKPDNNPNTKSDPTTSKNATAKHATITADQSIVIPQTYEKEIKSAPTTIHSVENSAAIFTPIPQVLDFVINNKPERNNELIKKQDPNKFIEPQTTGKTANKIPFNKTNPSQIETSKSIPTEIFKADETYSRNKAINGLSIIRNIETSGLTYDREIAFEIDVVDVVEKLDRPRHQINMTIGAGMTQLDIDDPFVGDITPVAASKQEAFLSLSYLYRMNRNWGIEIGAQVAGVHQEIAHYFQPGDFGLTVPEYGKTSVKAYEFKRELFANFHFFLPLNQRSELDFYGGFYALNPFSQKLEWGRGGGTVSFVNNNISLISSSVSSTSGIYNGGRVKLGMNYNFLTNKLNNVGIGIAYMHQIDNVVEGTYALISNTEESKGIGNLRANPSGFKVQMTFGFGLKRFPWNKRKLKRPSPKTPWYVGLRYGTKQYILSDNLSGDLVNAPSNKYQSIHIGHYIKQKMAFEFGLEYSEFTFSTPFGENILLKSQKLITIPFALRYDLLQNNRLSLYGKGVFSTDFRLSHNRNFTQFETGFATDENNLLLNAGLEAGIDFRIIKGVHIGLVGKYNQAFTRAAQYQFHELNAQNEIVFRDINLKNTSFSWGVEVKYHFNTN